MGEIIVQVKYSYSNVKLRILGDVYGRLRWEKLVQDSV